MAKMFYTLDETKSALSKNEEEIKQLSREGRLREFRDGPRLMFKADQVEALRSEAGAVGDAINLGPSDTGTGMGVVDSGRSASGTHVTLSDSQSSAAGAAPPAAKKEETAFADIGLSGTIGGVPSPGRISPGTGTGLSGLSSGHGTKSGITVFPVEEAERVDPSAQTAIGSGIQDQVNLEGIGSGSGLLDLTRESDDTSLGAVFDELAPPAQRQAPAKGAILEPVSTGSSMGMAAIGEPRAGRAAEPIYVQAPDAGAPAFGAMALAGALIVCFAGFIVAASVAGFKPEIVKSVYDGLTTWILGGLGVILVFGVVGFIIGKTTQK